MSLQSEQDFYALLMRVENGALVPELQLGQGMFSCCDRARQVAGRRPLCVDAALDYPGLLSVENPLLACCNCPLKGMCGSNCVETLSLTNEGDHTEYVVMYVQPHRQDTPDAEKKKLQHLFVQALGKKVEPKMRTVAA